MRWVRWAILVVSAVAVMALGIAIRAFAMPLGVKGEWEWARLTVSVAGLDLAFGSLGLLAYAGFAAMGMRGLRDHPGRLRESVWVAGLVGASIFVQVMIQSGAPEGFGLTKWVTLAMPGSSGYYEVAKRQMGQPGRFWAEYPSWIQRQDELHIGTHPPGLFLVARGTIGAMAEHPGMARWIAEHLPASVDSGFREILRGTTRQDRAAIAVEGALTLLLCASTVAPLYVLARKTLPASPAWAAAAIWPVVPSALLFQPTADTVFPLVSTLALAMASRKQLGGCVASGIVLAVGMQFSLVFLPVGLVVGLWIATDFDREIRRRAFAILAVGAGFLGLTLMLWGISSANPFVIWWWNQKNHSRFYMSYPRTYRKWIWVNLVEFFIALGLPVMIWCLTGLPRIKAARVSWITLAVVLLLNFSGKNLSEVARLWLPFMPPLCVAVAAGMERLEANEKTLAATIVLIGAEALALQAMLQVVYPFGV